MNTDHPLYALNQQLVALESARDIDALGPLLHDALVFRRANGEVASKAAYLASLAGIVSVRWSHSTVLDIQEHGDDLAVVPCLVAMDREQQAKSGARSTVQGVFFNLRVWSRSDGAWRLIGWFNQRA